MSQWTEVRHMHLVDGIPKKEIARRLNLDIKTVRRAIEQSAPPDKRDSPARGRLLDKHRERIKALIKSDSRITAKRIGRLLEEDKIVVKPRTLRDFVRSVRDEVRPKEAFVHRTQLPGQTMEVDFGKTLARVSGNVMRLCYVTSTLPASNAYFAKAYRTERLECFLDGLNESFRFFGGLTDRLVFDNASIAIRKILRGPDRLETKDFAGYRGSLPIRADYCAPAKGWEKGSVEGGVDYVRNNCFRPMPVVDSLDTLNNQIIEEMVVDQSRRCLDNGQLVSEALANERNFLRPLPADFPDTCRRKAIVIDKFGHIIIDGVRYSAPIEYAYKPAIASLYHDRVRIAVGDKSVADHARLFDRGDLQLRPEHVLPLLAKKHRAVDEASALMGWELPSAFGELRSAMINVTRKPNQEWIKVLLLMNEHGEGAVTAAVQSALDQGVPRFESIQLILRAADHVEAHIRPAPIRSGLEEYDVPEPNLAGYDNLLEAP